MLEVGGLRLNSPPLVNFHARVVWASLPSLFRVIVGRCLKFGGGTHFLFCVRLGVGLCWCTIQELPYVLCVLILC